MNFEGFWVFVGISSLISAITPIAITKLIPRDEPPKVYQTPAGLFAIWYYTTLALSGLGFWSMDKENGALSKEIFTRIDWNYGDAASVWYVNNQPLIVSALLIGGAVPILIAKYLRVVFKSAILRNQPESADTFWIRASVVLCTLCFLFPPTYFRSMSGRISAGSYTFLPWLSPSQHIEYIRLLIQFALVITGCYAWFKRK